MNYDIVLITTDQHRVDYTGFAENPQIPTPNMDFLGDACVFDRCVSANPVCAPARTALLTGKYTHQINMLTMAGDLDLQHPTYARALQNAGYHTSLVGKTHWLQGWHFNKSQTPRGQGHNLVENNEQLKRFGFDHLWNVSGQELAYRDYCFWCQHLERHGILEDYRDHLETFSDIDMPNAVMPEVIPWPFEPEHQADAVIGEQCVEAIESAPDDAPMFLHASFCGPHKPLNAPEEMLERADALLEMADNRDAPRLDGVGEVDGEWRQRWEKWRRGYVAKVAVIDDQVGRIMQALRERGRLNRTIILFTSDHGEMLGDEKQEGKSRPQWPSSRVPTAIYHPDHSTQQRVDTPVELTDLTATILDAAGLNPQDALSKSFPAHNDHVLCQSLMPIIRGETEKVRDMAFSEHTHWRMVESKEFKYVYRPAESLSGDPEEFLCRIDEEPIDVNNLVGEPEYAEVLKEHRRYMHNVMDHTPPAQHRWVPFPAHDISDELP